VTARHPFRDDDSWDAAPLRARDLLAITVGVLVALVLSGVMLGTVGAVAWWTFRLLTGVS
jgi:hypothetical protein